MSCSTVAGRASPAPTSAPLTPPSSTAPPATAPPTTPPPVTTPPPRPGRPWSVVVTFYAAGDNDPPGSRAIAHPNGRHRLAGGTGTYADPLSLASDTREIPVGTRVYYAAVGKYFVMEDDCVGCIADWQRARLPHIDLWAGAYGGPGVLACEDALTPDGRVTVEVGPPPGRPVDPRPLYTPGRCHV